MISIFIGKDNFSKHQRLKELAKETGVDLRWLREGDSFPGVGELGGTALFGPAEAYVFDNSIAKSGLLDNLESLLATSGRVIIVEDAAPKRGTALQSLVGNEAVEVVNFDPPETTELPAWIAQRAEHHGASINKEGIAELIAALVPQPASSWEKPFVDLRQIDLELQKLATYADGQAITADIVRELTKRNTETQVWHVINAIADKNSKSAFAALEKFLAEADDGGDDKSKIILLNALLADQFRNILLVQDMQNRSVPDSAILGQTGWKSGRLFQLKKLAARFNTLQVSQILQRLADLDVELKTSATPPRPIVDLILAQVL